MILPLSAGTEYSVKIWQKVDADDRRIDLVH